MTYEELLDKWLRKLGRPCTAGEIVHDLRQLEQPVRCKDCNNLRLVEGARGRWLGCSAIDGVDGNEFEVEGDFYCAWGERREDETD